MKYSVLLFITLAFIVTACNPKTNSRTDAETPPQVTDSIPETDPFQADGDTDSNQKLLVEDNAIYITTQKPGEMVTINTVALIEPGYIVIHKADADQKPGDVIGYAGPVQGQQKGITITLTEPIKHGQMLFAMLHTDDGDGQYEFPGDDGPLMSTMAEEPMMMVFEVDQNVNPVAEEPMM